MIYQYLYGWMFLSPWRIVTRWTVYKYTYPEGDREIEIGRSGVSKC